MRKWGVLAAAIAVPALLAAIQSAQAQGAPELDVFAGSVAESFLRYSQTLDSAPTYPVSVRSYSIREIEAMRSSRRSRDENWGRLPLRLSTSFNTAFPYGGNDGSEWKGKGLTTALSGGIWFRRGVVSGTVAPVMFRAENAVFRLMPNGQDANHRFADARFPTTIDKPQRFGVGPYSRLDLGESTLRVDYRGFAAGVSNASQWWGPSTEFPVVLGNNAGGFPHFFVGTASPRRLPFVNVHGRIVYGFLEQSAFSPVEGSTEFTSFEESGTRRFMAGIVALLQLRAIPGLEIGGSRFFHAANTNGGLTTHNLLLPFQGLLQSGLPVESDTIFGSFRAVRENQLASVFLRIAPPGTGVDLYGEYGREDHSVDMRDFILEPEHSSLTMVGLRKAWRAGERIRGVRGEFLNYQIASGVRSRFSAGGEGGAYTHSVLRQGHTHRGQLLASDVGPGSGTAMIISAEEFSRARRVMVYYRRATAHETPQFYVDEPIARPVDILNTLGLEWTRVGKLVDIGAGLAGTVNLNRYLQRDENNLSVTLSLQPHW